MEGSDTNVGNFNYPLRTLAACVEKSVDSGDSCTMRAGTYHEQITIIGKNNFTIKAYENNGVREDVTLDGTRAIEGTWTPVGDGSYEIGAPSFEPTQLFWGVNKTMLALSRH